MSLIHIIKKVSHVVKNIGKHTSDEAEKNFLKIVDVSSNTIESVEHKLKSMGEYAFNKAMNDTLVPHANRWFKDNQEIVKEAVELFKKADSLRKNRTNDNIAEDQQAIVPTGVDNLRWWLDPSHYCDLIVSAIKKTNSTVVLTVGVEISGLANGSGRIGGTLPLGNGKSKGIVSVDIGAQLGVGVCGDLQIDISCKGDNAMGSYGYIGGELGDIFTVEGAVNCTTKSLFEFIENNFDGSLDVTGFSVGAGLGADTGLPVGIGIGYTATFKDIKDITEDAVSDIVKKIRSIKL